MARPLGLRGRGGRAPPRRLGALLYHSRAYPALAGLGTLAYTFGLRHPFDADHIAAIDNTTRKLLQQGKRPLGMGFFYSLGHSTIVFSLTVGLVLATKTVGSKIPASQSYGGYVGAGVSGTFLWIIGLFNLIVLVDVGRTFLELKQGRYDRERLEQRLLDRGFMNRFFVGRFAGLIEHSWQMYPLGVLFGLGFDTAPRWGCSRSRPASRPTKSPSSPSCRCRSCSQPARSLMDTADGAFTSQAYGWAFSNPIRNVYYNGGLRTNGRRCLLVAVGSFNCLRPCRPSGPRYDGSSRG